MRQPRYSSDIAPNDGTDNGTSGLPHAEIAPWPCPAARGNTLLMNIMVMGWIGLPPRPWKESEGDE